MASAGVLPPPSPSPLIQIEESGNYKDAVTQPESADLSNSIPELTTKPAASDDDRVEALHLLADSVAQQRQLAANAVIFHPASLCVFVLLFGLVYQYLYKRRASDWLLIGTTTAGVLMAMLVTVRWLSGGYIDEAEKVGTWKWLDRGRDDSDSPAVGESDEILLTRFGDEVIGTIFVRGERDASATGSPRKSRKNAPVTGVIRGWTVKRRYRRKGIGQALLEEAVKLCRANGWSGPEFADDHANSARLLPGTFNGGFSKRERQAREMLERVKEEMGAVGGGKKGKR